MTTLKKATAANFLAQSALADDLMKRMLTELHQRFPTGRLIHDEFVIPPAPKATTERDS